MGFPVKIFKKGETVCSAPLPLPGVKACWLGLHQPCCSHEITLRREALSREGEN